MTFYGSCAVSWTGLFKRYHTWSLHDNRPYMPVLHGFLSMITHKIICLIIQLRRDYASTCRAYRHSTAGKLGNTYKCKATFEKYHNQWTACSVDIVSFTKLSYFTVHFLKHFCFICSTFFLMDFSPFKKNPLIFCTSLSNCYLYFTHL